MQHASSALLSCTSGLATLLHISNPNMGDKVELMSEQGANRAVTTPYEQSWG